MMYFDLRPGSAIRGYFRDGELLHEWQAYGQDRDGIYGLIGITPELLFGWPYYLSEDDMKPGYEFYIGPFELRCLGYSPWIRAYVARRIDA